MALLTICRKAPAATAARRERRSAPRLPGGRWGATIRDISATGIRIVLPYRVAARELLAVALPSPDGTRPLTARVVWVARCEQGWVHGCELTTRLGDDLGGWVA